MTSVIYLGLLSRGEAASSNKRFPNFECQACFPGTRVLHPKQADLEEVLDRYEPFEMRLLGGFL